MLHSTGDTTSLLSTLHSLAPLLAGAPCATSSQPSEASESSKCLPYGFIPCLGHFDGLLQVLAGSMVGPAAAAAQQKSGTRGYPTLQAAQV